MNAFHFGDANRDCCGLSTEERRKGGEEMHKGVSFWRYDHLSVAFCNEGSLYLSQKLGELRAIRSE